MGAVTYPDDQVAEMLNQYYIPVQVDIQKASQLADRYQALDQHAAARGGYYRDRGLGDAHYADVSRREEEYDDYLAEREKKLNRRHRRIAQEASRLLRRRVSGTTPEISRQKAEAKSLANYVPLPVSPEREVERILASYRRPKSPS